MSLELSKAQKEEIRRLTQKANRRIRGYIQMYEKAGYKTIPKEVTAGFGIQSRAQFEANNYALSRSVKFDNKADYKRHLTMLRRFDGNRVDGVPTVSEYNRISRSKLLQAFETSKLEVSKAALRKINKLNAADISQFWKDYSIRARRKGLQYSSEAVMMETAEGFEPLDNVHLLTKVLERR
jgi:uncharacterized protein (DUF2461 family)